MQRAAANGARPVPAIDTALAETVRLLEQLGHHVEAAAPALGVSWDGFVQANARIWCANLVPWIEDRKSVV